MVDFSSIQSSPGVTSGTMYVDVANSNEQLTPAILSQMAANGVTEINLSFTSPSNPNLSQYSSLIHDIHQAGMQVYISVGGDKSTAAGNVAAWNVTSVDAQNLAAQANQLGVDGIDFDYELDDKQDLGLSGPALAAYSKNLENYFSTVRQNLNPSAEMSLTLMGWPGHYIDQSTYQTGSLVDTFNNFSSIFHNNLNLMMYEDAYHQCLNDPTYGAGYVVDYINLAKHYNIPLNRLHIGFTDFDGVPKNPGSSFYPGSSQADGCNAADTYVSILKSLGYTPSDFGNPYWWPNESTKTNILPTAINEVNDFNHRLADPNWNPVIPPINPPVQPAEPSTLSYTVQKGDTLYQIAKDFGTTVALLQAWNPNLDPSNLQPGDMIKVAAGNAYLVQPKDSLYSIAQFFNTSVTVLETLNPDVNPSTLNPGDVIALPAGHAYEVQQGDSLYKIAQTMQTTVDAIEEVNPGLNPSTLQPGQVIAMPQQITS